MKCLTDTKMGATTMFEKKQIYLDNTATTRTRREVIREMQQYFSTVYANPSSIHQDGLIARGSIEMARERISAVLNCASDEIIFTGSGTESNNLSIRGVAMTLTSKGRHIITSQIEHSSIINTCKALEREGYEVTYLRVDSNGNIDLEELSAAIKPTTILVSLHYINNEIGTIQDMEKIVSIVKSKNIILHFDAVQALPYLNIDLSKSMVDLVSFSGHKLYAPKGVGLLYIRSGTIINPIIFGGEQEFGIRSGTENIPYIVGLSKAIQLNHKEKTQYVTKLMEMRDYLIKNILENIDDCILTGSDTERSPNHASFCFKDLNGKMLVKYLSQKGFEVSSGAACSSPKNSPSHVIEALGIAQDYLYGSLRITVGKYNSLKDIKKFVVVLKDVIASMRSNKPIYNNEKIFISQKNFKELLKSDKSLQVLDVRHVNYPKFTIPGSLFIPVWKLKSNIKKLDKAAETIVVCFQGDIISPQVHQTLVKAGFTNVKVLKGGLFAYL